MTCIEYCATDPIFEVVVLYKNFGVIDNKDASFICYTFGLTIKKFRKTDELYLQMSNYKKMQFQS